MGSLDASEAFPLRDAGMACLQAARVAALQQAVQLLAGTRGAAAAAEGLGGAWTSALALLWDRAAAVRGSAIPVLGRIGALAADPAVPTSGLSSSATAEQDPSPEFIHIFTQPHTRARIFSVRSRSTSVRQGGWVALLPILPLRLRLGGASAAGWGSASAPGQQHWHIPAAASS